jgi:hypothetical protein
VSIIKLKISSTYLFAISFEIPAFLNIFKTYCPLLGYCAILVLQMGKLKRPGLIEAARGQIRAAGYPDEKTTPGGCFARGDKHYYRFKLSFQQC